MSEVLDGFHETDLHGHYWLPPDLGLRGGDVGLALARVVLGFREKMDRGVALSQAFD